ncbi:hypothetical protein [Variovorax saccharolyticus]|uniref:hypothetical protein n=1 Tax=Variovorax saccharolyticus TaxID=3053516 RepID=UPI0025766C1A|nr:hypothetical protein [Variovorax sp. J22R187]MDM0017069.1 hypothetical protein [Variovorax sp. J22R187]
MKRSSLAAACLLAASAAQAAADAEFAVRWDPAEGGPATIEAVAEALRLPEGKRKSFEVRYFSIVQPADAPPGASAIARERLSGGQMESMYKLRSPVAFPSQGAQADWRCPFKVDAKRQKEVDIGWSAEGVTKTNYSRSCAADGRIADLLPARFMAKPLDCSSSMLRMSSRGIKIERWSLPGGRQAFEVSTNGKDTGAERKAFASGVVQPLIARGARPLQQSKTQLGSAC